ncbi:MAG: hypothetical protein GXY32_04920 [Ruminococcaceae bacterium]|nr:hypothetical protein [Oscillospiraceae bacterium]
MDEQSFDRFDDTTFSVTISLAEYRALVAGQALANHEISQLYAQVDELTARNAGLIEQVQMLQDKVVEDDAPDD